MCHSGDNSSDDSFWPNSGLRCFNSTFLVSAQLTWDLDQGNTSYQTLDNGVEKKIRVELSRAKSYHAVEMQL